MNGHCLLPSRFSTPRGLSFTTNLLPFLGPLGPGLRVRLPTTYQTLRPLRHVCQCARTFG